jgi:hypothetical protein
MGSLRIERAVLERCSLAVRRRDCLRKLEAIGDALPADEQDARWLAEWDAALLDGCADAGEARSRHALAKQRVDAWRALEQALDGRHLTRVRGLATPPVLRNYPPAERRRAEIDDLVRKAEQAERVLEVLLSGAAGAFTEADLEFVRGNPELFQPYREQLEELLKRWLEGEVQLQAGDPPALTEARTGAVTARWPWPWPHFGKVFYCRVATDPGRFFNTPAEPRGSAKLYGNDHARTGGFSVVPMPGWRKAYVTVWPVIDLGWGGEIAGRPLKLGPFPLAAPR